jgi:hypothetical protein
MDRHDSLLVLTIFGVRLRLKRGDTMYIASRLVSVGFRHLPNNHDCIIYVETEFKSKDIGKSNVFPTVNSIEGWS